MELFKTFDVLKNDPNYSPMRSAQWYQDKIKENFGGRVSVLKVLGDYQTQQTNYPIPGTMCFYTYDPKTKEDLPYYDTVPLILPFSFEGQYVTGLNLHYLYPMVRYRLLAKLVEIKVEVIDPKKKIALSWELLNSVSQFPEVRPAVKKYIFTGKHVKSNVLTIAPEDWVQAIFLPLARFKKKTEKQVWEESKQAAARVKRRGIR